MEPKVQRLGVSLMSCISTEDLQHILDYVNSLNDVLCVFVYKNNLLMLNKFLGCILMLGTMWLLIGMWGQVYDMELVKLLRFYTIYMWKALRKKKRVFSHGTLYA